jgi:PAP2 superfamily
MHALARCWAPGGGRARGPLIEPAVYSAILRWRPHIGRKSSDGQPSAANGEPHGEPHDGPPHNRPSPDRLPHDTRPRGGALGQVALVVGAWIAYSLARSLSGDDVDAAIHRGRLLQHWDSLLGFGWTIDLNHWVSAHALPAVPMTLEYASLHYLVTPLVLVWLWRAHPETYRSALLALIGMSAVGLVVYIVMPVAPPRLLPGSEWIDTMSTWSHIGWWGNAGSAPAGMGHLTDQYAAMPSLHVGWAVWCAWAWHRVGGNATLRRLAWIYPATVAATVVATANHYVLDVAAGVALAVVACELAPRVVAHLRVDRAIDLDHPSVGAAQPQSQAGRQPAYPLMGFITADLIKLIDLRDDVGRQREPIVAESARLSESREEPGRGVR